MANKHRKKCSVSLAIKRMQVKTTVTHPYAGFGAAKIKTMIPNAKEGAEELDPCTTSGNVKGNSQPPQEEFASSLQS